MACGGSVFVLQTSFVLEIWKTNLLCFLLFYVFSLWDGWKMRNGQMGFLNGLVLRGIHFHLGLSFSQKSGSQSFERLSIFFSFFFFKVNMLFLSQKQFSIIIAVFIPKLREREKKKLRAKCDLKTIFFFK